MRERDTAGGRRLVVLDIDDTLYLERDYVRSGFAAVGAWARDELGVDDLGDRAWAAFEAGVRRTIFDEALAGSGVEATDDLVPRLVEVYRSHAPTIELLTDARDWLDGLAPHVLEVHHGKAHRPHPRTGHRAGRHAAPGQSIRPWQGQRCATPGASSKSRTGRSTGSRR